MANWAARLGWVFSLVGWAWVTPKTWSVDELVTASDLNTHLRDNLNALKAPPSASVVLNQASDYTTSNTSFVDIDATTLALTITTTGGDVFVHFHGVVGISAGGVCLDFTIDGTRHAGDDGIMRSGSPNEGETLSFTRLVMGLSAGSHVFKLQWKTTSGGTATLYAGAGTANFDVHAQFWARELS
jgi:hypothetical protein